MRMLIAVLVVMLWPSQSYAEGQDTFVRIITAAAEAYGSQNTELQRTNIRMQRREALCRTFPSVQVQNWVGQVINVTSRSDGRAGLKVQIGPKIIFETQRYMDFSRTLIGPSDPLYPVLLGLRRGDTIVFSGALLSDRKDCFRENSLTEAGSIRSPDFTFKFTSVTKR